MSSSPPPRAPFAISAPVTVFAGIGAASRTGHAVKGDALERLARVRVAAFDKTGSLTRNEPTIVKVATSGMDRSSLLDLAATLEANSHHPLAAALIEAGTPSRSATDVHTVPGAGITAPA